MWGARVRLAASECVCARGKEKEKERERAACRIQEDAQHSLKREMFALHLAPARPGAKHHSHAPRAQGLTAQRHTDKQAHRQTCAQAR